METESGRKKDRGEEKIKSERIEKIQEKQRSKRYAILWQYDTYSCFCFIFSCGSRPPSFSASHSLSNSVSFFALFVCSFFLLNISQCFQIYAMIFPTKSLFVVDFLSLCESMPVLKFFSYSLFIWHALHT